MTTVIPDELTELETKLSDNVACDVNLGVEVDSPLCGKPAHWRVQFEKCGCPAGSPGAKYIYLLCDQHCAVLIAQVTSNDIEAFRCCVCKIIAIPIPPIMRI